MNWPKLLLSRQEVLGTFMSCVHATLGSWPTGLVLAQDSVMIVLPVCFTCDVVFFNCFILVSHYTNERLQQDDLENKPEQIKTAL